MALGIDLLDRPWSEPGISLFRKVRGIMVITDADVHRQLVVHLNLVIDIPRFVVHDARGDIRIVKQLNRVRVKEVVGFTSETLILIQLLIRIAIVSGDALIPPAEEASLNL